MKYKKYLFLFLALIAAAVAAGGIYLYLQELEARAKLTTEYTDVVVARRTISVNETVTEDMLELKEIPIAFAHGEAAGEIEVLTGGIARTDIYRGEQVLDDKIVAPGDTEDEFVYIISPGKRAVSISLNEVIGVGGLLVPGDYVDVIATLEGRDGEDFFDYSKIIVQNVKVLAIGRRYDPFKFGEVTEQAGTITLEVTPEQAPNLVLASERGSVRLLLRSPGDDEDVPSPPWRLQDYLR